MKLGDHATNAHDMCVVMLRDGMTRIRTAAETVIGECAESTELDECLSALQRLAQYGPIRSVQVRRRIARRLLDEDRYVV